MSFCPKCHGARLRPLISLPAQPVSNKLTAAANERVATVDLELAVCEDCGLGQLTRPIPYELLVPPFKITYREPEAHLDAVFEKLRTLPGLSSDKSVMAVTYKDKTLLDRFIPHGFDRLISLDVHHDLGAIHPAANVETAQHLLTTAQAAKIVQRHGTADVVLARHIVEHAEDMGRLLAGLADLVAPDGYLVIEVPCCLANLERQDYTMIWEEHRLYFTPATLAGLGQEFGLETVSLDSYPFPFENSLVLVARKTGNTTAPAPVDADRLQVEIHRLAAYGDAFAHWTQSIRQSLQDLGGAVAMYGAGHLTCAFVHYHGLAGLITCVLDDTPEKQGRFLPGTAIPVLSSDFLASSAVTACIFGLAPEVEDRIVARHQPFIARGGRFLSAFPASNRSLRGA